MLAAKSFSFILIVVYLFPLDNRGQEAPTVVAVKSPALAKLQGPATGEVVWVYDERFFPAEQVEENRASRRLVLSGTGGPHLVTAVVIEAGKAPVKKVWLVTFEGGPGPTPPFPPVPSTLRDKLQRAYTADVTAGKASPDRKGELTKLFANAGDFIVFPTTVGQAADLLKFALASVVKPPLTMPATGLVITEYMNEKLPRDPALPMTDALRVQYRQFFAEVATALEGVK